MTNQRSSIRIQCPYFEWRISQRSRVYQADGRGNCPSTGRHSLGTKDYETAIENLKRLDMKVAIDRGLAPRVQSQATEYGELMLQAGTDEYLGFIARPRSMKGCSKNTQKRYRPVFAKAVQFFEGRGQRTWNQIGREELDAYVGWLEQKHYAYATQLFEAVTLKQALNHWIEKGLLPPERQFKLEIDKVTETNTYCFTAAEVAAMIRHCGASGQLSWLGDVIVGLGYSGMRIGELTMLRWSAIDFKRNMMSVVDDSRSTRSKRDNARSTKSSRSRSIPIHVELRATLERIQRPRQGGLVFTAQRGGPLHPRNVLQALIDDVILPLQEQFPCEDGERGFATGRLHSLRHYFCSWCANAGVSESVLMEWLGHGSSAMVRRYYHLHDDEAQVQMQKLGKMGVLGVS